MALESCCFEDTASTIHYINYMHRTKKRYTKDSPSALLIMTSLLYTILHYIRLVWTYISSFFNNNDRSGGGISLSSFFGHKQKILTFDNGLQVQIGKQIAEGGFSYVFEAFPITPDNNSGTPSKQSRMLSQSSSLTSSSSTPTERKYALKRINCAGKFVFVLFYRMNSSVQYEASVVCLYLIVFAIHTY